MRSQRSLTSAVKNHLATQHGQIDLRLVEFLDRLFEDVAVEYDEVGELAFLDPL
jgi:hypothetical protein